MLWLMSPLMILGLQGSLVPGVGCGSGFVWQIDDLPIERSYIGDLPGRPCDSLASVALSLTDNGDLYAYWWDQEDDLNSQQIAEGVVDACAHPVAIYYVTQDKKLWAMPISWTTDNWAGRVWLEETEHELLAKAVSTVSVALDHVLFVTTGGELFLKGNNTGAEQGSPLYEEAPQYCFQPVKLLSGVKSVSAGLETSVVILMDDSLWAVGSSWLNRAGISAVRSGKLSMGKLVEGMKAASVGISHCLMISNENQLWLIGDEVGYEPLFVADDVLSVVARVGAQADHGALADYSFVTRDGGFYTAHNRSLTRQGRGVTAVVRYNTGILYRRQGSPLFRFKIPYAEDGSSLGNLPDSGVSFLAMLNHEFYSSLEYRDYDGLNHQVLTGPEAGAKPVRRFLNLDSFGQFYTLNDAEIDACVADPGYHFGEVAFYAFETQVEGTKPVYRFYSERTRSHFYTIFENEKDWILENVPEYELRLEGIAWYALPAW